MPRIRRTADKLWPIVIMQDRHFGDYSKGGPWFAIAHATTPVEDFDIEPTRAGFCLEHGPNGDDDEAIAFWKDQPDWISCGATASSAVENLVLKTTDFGFHEGKRRDQ